MRTLKSIAFVVKDDLAGGDATIDQYLDERDIMIFARAKMNELLKLQFYQNKQDGDNLNIPIYLATYNSVAVAANGTTGFREASLPEGYVGMPYAQGIHHVSPMADLTKDIIPNNNYHVNRDLDMAYMELNPSYRTEGLKLIFSERNWNVSWTSVQIILLIAAPATIGESDSLPLLPDQEAALILSCKEHFRKLVPVDALNDGNPDKGVIKQ